MLGKTYKIIFLQWKAEKKIIICKRSRYYLLAKPVPKSKMQNVDDTKRVCFLDYLSILKMEATYSFEMLDEFQWTTRRYVPEDELFSSIKQ
jgi:hypothetical protein